MTDIDWDRLRTEAISAMRRAYAPYSNYSVGAAALVDDGRTVSGCNVENASYGVGLCAECGLVSALHMSGGGRLTAFVCVNGAEEIIMPCGRQRLDGARRSALTADGERLQRRTRGTRDAQRERRPPSDSAV